MQYKYFLFTKQQIFYFVFSFRSYVTVFTLEIFSMVSGKNHTWYYFALFPSIICYVGNLSPICIAASIFILCRLISWLIAHLFFSDTILMLYQPNYCSTLQCILNICYFLCTSHFCCFSVKLS